MNNRLEEIAQRKRTLIDKASAERRELAAAYSRIRSPIEIGATLLGIGRALKSHPVVAAGVTSFIVTGYAGKLLKSAGDALRVVKLARPLWNWWKERTKK